MEAEIDRNSTVRDIIERYPILQAVLAEHGLDLCCGGIHSLETAARAHGQDPVKLLAELKEALRNGK